MDKHDLHAPEDRFCDLIMKGGVTSGVIYPPAICDLAKHYRFKGIGGTSAGAIAAAACAAAELQRRQSGSMAGFQLLSQLPEALIELDGRRRSRLQRLFQPQASCRRLFRALTEPAGQGMFRILGIIRICTTIYWEVALGGVLLFLSGLLIDSWLAAFLLLLVGASTIAGSAIYRDLKRAVENTYGLCSGMTTDPEAGAALTPWLHDLIQRAAGRTPDEQPVTFGDLWHAPGFPPKSIDLTQGAEVARRSIDLKMVVTSLTHGRPYILPHLDPTARLFYRPEELCEYLPETVMRWINEHSLPYSPSTLHSGDPPAEVGLNNGLKEIPAPEDFPILLAARMSLSFPLLISAVPLYAVDYHHPREQRRFGRCIFSDGGISSNFPMHLFDDLLPLWPTFGISLESPRPMQNTLRTFLPRSYWHGTADRWNSFDEESRASSRLAGFLASIVDSMQNWSDNEYARMPGVRDRVVTVRLEPGQGGLNLHMSQSQIVAIAEQGRQAGRTLLDNFLGVQREGITERWDEHRLLRLLVLVRALGPRLAALPASLADNIPYGNSYRDLVARLESQIDVTTMSLLLDAMEKVANEFNSSSLRSAGELYPQPALRIRPTL
jgi:predicted acylesterase/phospholipase RssA